MVNLDEDPAFQELLDRVLERLHAGLEVDVDGMGVENKAYRQALHQAVVNWQAIHAAPLGGSRHARARNLLHTHPEFDGYRLTKIIGQGGCSVVFRAADINAGGILDEDDAHLADVAIKVFTGGVDHSTLKKELASLVSLSEVRCVPTIRKCGEVDGFPYLVMQLIKGKPLISLLPPGQPLVPPERSRTLIADISRALAEVADHVRATRDGQELVHGDIKPQNIIVSDGGKVTLLDFSVAMLRNPGRRTLGENTLSSAVGYTPHYASPEMLIGNRTERITPASDIFQVGLLAFRMMTGRNYWRVASDERQALLWRHPDSRLCRVAEQALDWNPARRFPSASKMYQALRRRSLLTRVTRIPRRRIFRAAAVTIAAMVVVFSSDWLARSWRGDARKTDLEKGLKESRGKTESVQAEVANLQEKVQVLVRTMAQPPSGDRKPYEQRIASIRAWYDKIKNGTAAEDDLAGLEEDCRGFMEDFPVAPLARTVAAMGTWLHEANTKGIIRVEPVELREKAYRDSTTMRYRIALRGVPWDYTKRTVTYVELVDHRADLASKRFFETPWRPDKRIDVQVGVWEKERVDHFPLDGDGEILKSKEDVIEKFLRTSGDDDFTFRFRIKRIGFGPMPERP